MCRPHLMTVFPEHHDGVSRLDIDHVEISSSAREHGIGDVDIVQAVGHAVVAGGQDDGRVLCLGPDRAGNLLEVVTALRDDGTEIVSRAMRVRRSYELLLTTQESPIPGSQSFGQPITDAKLTDEVLEQMAREAEAGLDVTTLRCRPRRPAFGSGQAGTLPVRLEPELRRARDERSATGRTTASEVVGEALRQKGVSPSELNRCDGRVQRWVRALSAK